MPEENVQTCEVRVLIGNHLAQEAVEVTERLDLAAPELRFRLVLLLQQRKTGHCRIKGGVHGLMIHGALLWLGFEVDGTEALYLFDQIDPRRIQLTLELEHVART